MVLGYNNDDGAQALDQQQEIDFRRGWQVVDAASGSNLVTDGTGSYEVDVAAGDINTPSGTVTCSAATLDLQSLVDPDLPRIVIVYRDASGVAQTLAGTPAAKQPEGETAPGPIYQPAPDAFSTTDGIVLATVLLESAASSVGSGQIRDRRMPASLNVESAEVGSLNTVDLTDGVAGDGNSVERVDGDLGEYRMLGVVTFQDVSTTSDTFVSAGDLRAGFQDIPSVTNLSALQVAVAGFVPASADTGGTIRIRNSPETETSVDSPGEFLNKNIGAYEGEVDFRVEIKSDTDGSQVEFNRVTAFLHKEVV